MSPEAARGDNEGKLFKCWGSGNFLLVGWLSLRVDAALDRWWQWFIHCV